MRKTRSHSTRARHTGVAMLFTLLPFLLAAQDIMTVTSQVLPPHDGSFTNFHTKAIVTVHNTTQQGFDVQLVGRLTGNGISIEFRPNPDPVFFITPNQTLVLSQVQLMPYFQEQNVGVTGITKDELYRGDGLPPGTYQLCFRARNALTGTFLSMDAPSGCFPFTVQPPVVGGDVRLTTQVIPPYSTYLDDYINQNKLLVMLQNLTGSTQELRLIGSIKGNNGVVITIPDKFIPSKPITLSTRGVLQLTGNDLREYFSETVLQIEGANRDEITRGNGLPEGNYQWCLQAVDYKTGEPRSAASPAGCAVLDIRQFEPPFTIQPACNTVVNAVQPQNILFTWSIPAGARPDQVEYILKIIELYPQDIDPNQAMLSANVPPLFEKVVQTNSYIYSLADPKLQVGRKYAYRVTARTNLNSRRGRRNGPMNFRNNGHSQVCTFTYGNTSTAGKDHEIEYDLAVGTIVQIDPKDVVAPSIPPQQSPDPEDSDECVAACTITAPVNTSSKNIGIGDVVKVGKFTMTVTSGNNSSGTGTILMNFLNTPVNVVWNNIQVNTNNEMFGAGSKITAVMDMNELTDKPYVIGNAWNGNDVQPDAQAIKDQVQQASRKVSTFPANNNQPIGLPLALDHGHFDLVILGLNFTPTEATINAVALVELANSTTPGDHLILTASSCVRPNGFGADNEVALGSNKTIPFSDHARMILTTNTNAAFDCQGISQINLSGKLEFDRELVLPVQNDGDVVAAPAKVSATFNTSVTDLNNWTLDIGSLSHPFTIPALVGFRMTASSITIDQSDTETPAGIGKPATWKGLYIGSVQVVLNGIFQKNNNPLALSVSNFSIGNQGLSGDIDPPGNILQLDEGKIGTWPIAVDNFDISINNSSIDGSTIEGRLKLPIAANELNYSITVIGSQDENEIVDFQFNVQQATDLDVDMWFASIDLEETSTIGIHKVGDNYRPTADLTGKIEISWNSGNGPAQNNSVGNFEMPELDFEHLTIEDNGAAVPNINVGMMEVANADGLDLQLATFSAHFDPPGFVKNGNKIGLAFDIDLELIKMTNSLNGETAFTIFAEYVGNKFQYKETKLNKIALNGDIGVAQLWGQIDIYSQDATYGNGFRGQIKVIINAIGGAGGVDATLQAGKVNGFNYWYFDVMATLPGAGINIPGTMASIYGIGGGAWGNMTRGDTEAQTVDQLNAASAYSHTPGANKDGLTFTPEQGTFGFSAAVAFGLTGAKSGFNGDLKFSMQLLSSGAVEHVILEGNCYVMQDIDDRDGGMITGFVYAEIQPRIPNASDAANAAENRPNFRFLAGINVDIANGLVTGAGSIDLWFSPAEWWIKIGEWKNEDYPWQDSSRVNLSINLKIVQAHFHSYFMMGSNIPGMPKMPLVVREQFQQDNVSLNPAPRIGLFSTNNPNAVPPSPGIAFGAGSNFEADMKFLIFYADIQFAKGFDILLKKYASSSCGPNIGINGWYAKGQAYFYLNFDVGVEIDIWVWEGKASIIATTAAATIQAALPNPVWLKGQFAFSGEVLGGLFKFNTSFRFELGEKCDFGGSSPFDEMPIISDITPDKNETGVSVYIVPETAFNFPKGNFSYDEEVDGELVTKTYKYVFKTFTLSYKEPGTNANKVVDLKPFMNYRPGNLSATYYYPDMMLPEYTNINYTIYVEGWQMAPGTPKKVHEESYTGSFQSGSWPAHIEPEQLVKGNPQWRQNFFLKSEESTGYLEFKNPHPHFTNASWWYSNVFKLGTYSGIGSGTFVYKARFKELETAQTYETNYSMQTPKKMVFNIPAGMKNNKIYQLELVARYTPPINSFALGGSASNVNETYQNILLSGQQGGGGSNGIQALIAQMPGNNPDNVIQGSGNMQATVGNQSSSQQMLVNNYEVMASAGQQMMPVQQEVVLSSAQNATFQIATNLQSLNPGTGTYIQRRKNELIKKKTGDQGIEWPLFDDLQWFFKTSRYNTLQAKLNGMKHAGVVYHEYSGSYERFNDGDILHEPFGGEGSTITITTKVPIVLLEIEETFERPYEIGGYAITIAGNQNEQINVPPMVKMMHGFNDWMSDHFFYAPTDPYGLPDWDDWAQLPFYEDDDGMFLGYYDQLGHLYPGQHWENFVPQPFNNDPWFPDRHSGGNNAKPFGNQNFSTPYEVMSDFHKPMQVFFKNEFTHGDVDFGNKGVTWFKTSLLEGDAITNAINKGKQAGGDDDDDGGGGSSGVLFGGMNLQANVYGQVNPGIQQGTQLVANTKQHLAVIDYTEWVAMRDFYLLQKYVYQMNEEEEGSFFTACQGSMYSNDNTTNCYYPGIKNWINNVWRYQPRPPGQYSFRLGNENTHREFEFELNTTLNDEN